MPVHHVKSIEEFENLKKTNKFVILDAFATWCGPCKMIAPVMEKLSGENTNVKFLKFDVDELEELGADLGIRAMPTFIGFRDGAEVLRISGANPALLEAKVKELQGTS
jgi:thioredoxin 1